MRWIWCVAFFFIFVSSLVGFGAAALFPTMRLLPISVRSKRIMCDDGNCWRKYGFAFSFFIRPPWDFLVKPICHIAWKLFQSLWKISEQRPHRFQKRWPKIPEKNRIRKKSMRRTQSRRVHQLFRLNQYFNISIEIAFFFLLSQKMQHCSVSEPDRDLD